MGSPIQNGGSFQFAMLVYQRVPTGISQWRTIVDADNLVNSIWFMDIYGWYPLVNVHITNWHDPSCGMITHYFHGHFQWRREITRGRQEYGKLSIYRLFSHENLRENHGFSITMLNNQMVPGFTFHLSVSNHGDDFNMDSLFMDSLYCDICGDICGDTMRYNFRWSKSVIFGLKIAWLGCHIDHIFLNGKGWRHDQILVALGRLNVDFCG